MKKFWLFVLAIVISFLPGIIGMMFSPTGASDVWYNALVKPAVMPAGWVFAVVWPILYLILGIALYLIIVDKTRYSKSMSYWAFGAHVVLNALWSYLFFGANLMAGCADCVDWRDSMDDDRISANQSACVLHGVAVFVMVGVCVVFEWGCCVFELKIRRLADFYIFKILKSGSPMFKYFNPNSST